MKMIPKAKEENHFTVEMKNIGKRINFWSRRNRWWIILLFLLQMQWRTPFHELWDVIFVCFFSSTSFRRVCLQILEYEKLIWFQSHTVNRFILLKNVQYIFDLILNIIFFKNAKDKLFSDHSSIEWNIVIVPCKQYSNLNEKEYKIKEIRTQ